MVDLYEQPEALAAVQSSQTRKATRIYVPTFPRPRRRCRED